MFKFNFIKRSLGAILTLSIFTSVFTPVSLYAGGIFAKKAVKKEGVLSCIASLFGRKPVSNWDKAKYVAAKVGSKSVEYGKVAGKYAACGATGFLKSNKKGLTYCLSGLVVLFGLYKLLFNYVDNKANQGNGENGGVNNGSNQAGAVVNGNPVVNGQNNVVERKNWFLDFLNPKFGEFGKNIGKIIFNNIENKIVDTLNERSALLEREKQNGYAGMNQGPASPIAKAASDLLNKEVAYRATQAKDAVKDAAKELVVDYVVKPAMKVVTPVYENVVKPVCSAVVEFPNTEAASNVKVGVVVAGLSAVAIPTLYQGSKAVVNALSNNVTPAGVLATTALAAIPVVCHALNTETAKGLVNNISEGLREMPSLEEIEEREKIECEKERAFVFEKILEPVREDVREFVQAAKNVDLKKELGISEDIDFVGEPSFENFSDNVVKPTTEAMKSVKDGLVVFANNEDLGYETGIEKLGKVVSEKVVENVVKPVVQFVKDEPAKLKTCYWDAPVKFLKDTANCCKMAYWDAPKNMAGKLFDKAKGFLKFPEKIGPKIELLQDEGYIVDTFESNKQKPKRD